MPGKKINAVKLRNEASGIPRFDDNPGRIRVRYFYVTGSGNFSKRAFFFSVFAFIAVIYTVLCLCRAVDFSIELSGFILACNTAFGINYYANEKSKPALLVREPEADVSGKGRFNE
jgi:hypothetical protein